MTKMAGILGAGALIAFAIGFAGRWEFAAYGGEVYRLDRWTGDIFHCNASPQEQANARVSNVGVRFEYAP